VSPVAIAANVAEAAALVPAGILAWRKVQALPRDRYLRGWAGDAIVYAALIFVGLSLVGGGPIWTPIITAVLGPVIALRTNMSWGYRPSPDELAYRAERERLRAFFRDPT
jgi:hypothetical protein